MPTDHALVRPLHLAGRGASDVTTTLTTHFGWVGDDLLLASPDGHVHLARRPDPDRWELTVPSPHSPRARWSATFDDRAPAEIATSVLHTLAHGLEHWPQQLLHPLPGHDAALAVLSEGGWAHQQRDGHDVLLAPDRRAALTRPIGSDDAPTVLTGAAEEGTWSTVFSARTPAVLLQSAAVTLLRPALRPIADLPSAHREFISIEAVAPLSAQRVRVSPRHLAGADPGPVPLPGGSALWHRTRPERVESSCRRVLVEAVQDRRLQVTAGPWPEGPGSRLAWTAEFTGVVPSEITRAWLDSLTGSLAADIDLGTDATLIPGPGMSVGDAVEPLTDAGWIVHTDDADLHLVSPDGYATARLTHGLLAPGTAKADAFAHTSHWGATIDVTGAPGQRWRAAMTSLTPLHLVRALAEAVTDPAPVTRRPDHVPAQHLDALRMEAADIALSPAAQASRSRRTRPFSTRTAAASAAAPPTPAHASAPAPGR
ncbi:DUF317 domain-containing protein [Kitasatospora sp. NPDC057965]|uniref:DUF317 domain-containing protein n=1 Tax=Kitasatospora sp. NPDC057965 TaxID=3346291 RepID=UPI0036DA7085